MADAEPTKICARCHIEKPHCSYYMRGDRNAPRSACIECLRTERAGQGRINADRSAAWRAADPERARLSIRASHLKHIERRRADDRKRWHENEARRNKSLSRLRAYRQANPEENNNRQARARRAARAEEFREWFREYHRRNPERRKVYCARRRALKHGNGGNHTAQDARELRAIQRDRCAICGARLHGGGELDHIVPLARGGSNGRRNLQWACSPCNRSKRASDPIDFMRRRGLLL